jgi:hypothetical protein
VHRTTAIAPVISQMPASASAFLAGALQKYIALNTMRPRTHQKPRAAVRPRGCAGAGPRLVLLNRRVLAILLLTVLRLTGKDRWLLTAGGDMSGTRPAP